METITETDSLLATDGNRVVSKIPLSSVNQTLSFLGTEITISGPGGNTIDLNSLGGSGAWGTILGTLSDQIDLQNALNAKQDNLISATNIRTINGLDVLGSGNLVVTASGGEANNLTEGVTWVNIPDANVPVTAVTQHNAALSITESQITDLNHTDPNAFKIDGSVAMIGNINTNGNNINLNGGVIANMLDPLNNQDAATKIYVDQGRANGSETVINAGTNITITGNGQSLSPYVVNSTATSGTNHIDSTSPISNFDFSYGTTSQLNAQSPAGPTIEIASDGAAGTDGYVTAVNVTGTTTKTITLARNGLPDVSTTFTDDGSGGAGDGNDYLLGVTQNLGVLTFNVQNQTDPTFNLKSYLDDLNYSVGPHTVDTNTQLTELQVDNFVSNNGYSTRSIENVQDLMGNMVSGNTETGVNVTYQDIDGTLDFVLNPAIGTINGNVLINNSINPLKIQNQSLTGNQMAFGSISISKLQDMSSGRVIGRTGGTIGPPSQINFSEMQTTHGPVFTSSVRGLVPNSGGGTSNFLRADGTWQAPSGGITQTTGTTTITLNGISGGRTTTANWIKTGNQVTVSFRFAGINGTTNGVVTISGMPFGAVTPSNHNYYMNTGTANTKGIWPAGLVFSGSPNTSMFVRIRSSASNENPVQMNIGEAFGVTGEISATITYQTN